MQRTSKGDCKAPEIVQGEAIRGWRTIPVGSCSRGRPRWSSFLVSAGEGGHLCGCFRGRISCRVLGWRRCGRRRGVSAVHDLCCSFRSRGVAGS